MTDTTLAIVALTTGDLMYQITGMLVVFCCLGFLSILLTISGSVAKRLDARRKQREDAAKAQLAAAAPKPQAPAPAPAPAPAAAPAPGELSAEQVAALAAGIFNAARSSLTPEIVAAIAAAIKVTVGSEARILDIKPVNPSYAQSGRALHMSSHFPVRK